MHLLYATLTIVVLYNGVECQRSQSLNLDVVNDQQSYDDSVTGCGKDKGCFRTPFHCNSAKDCDHLVTWTVEKDVVSFSVSTTTNNETRWTAVGLSLDQKMGSDSVTDCIYDQDTASVIIQSSWNNDIPNNVVLKNKNLGLFAGSTHGAYSNGVLHCTYKRYIHNNNTAGSENQIYNLDRKFYILLPKGSASDSGIKFPHTVFPSISPIQVDVTSDDYVNIGGPKVMKTMTLIMAHGSLMMIAWMLYVSVGVLLPRYFKTAWKETTICGKSMWFQIHRVVMTLAMLLTMTGFIIIFIEVKGYASHLTGVSAAHPILGIIVTCLVIINPILGVCRPQPDAPLRRVFNMVHFTVGTAALITAFVTMFIGTMLVPAEMSWWAKWVVLGFVVWFCIIEIVLAIYHHRTKNITFQTNDVTTMTVSVSEDTGLVGGLPNVEKAERQISTVKTAIVGVHVAVALCCTIVLILDLTGCFSKNV